MRTLDEMPPPMRATLLHIRAMLDAAHERRRASEWFPRNAPMTPERRAKLKAVMARIAAEKAAQDE